ncbi:hypothetical protein SESBI_34061 [Sesbania bispinosa]|nr:hypothetical protein SESBI_34061 [Sesbania bispinosa]
MECNKDEAARAKEIAERKFSEREYTGAKRKQYRKLALTLHPDKNKSLGAEGAFKLVSEAWSLLSDKVKRLAYNQNRSSEGFQHYAPNHVGSRSEAPSSNVFYNLKKNATSNERTGNNNVQPPATSIPPHNIAEKGPPPNVVKSSKWAPRQHHQKSQHHAGRNHPMNPGRTCAVSQNTDSFNNTNFQWGPHSRMAGFVNTDEPSSVAAASVKQQASEKRRESEGAPSIAAWERSRMYKRSDGSFSDVGNPMKKIKKDDIYMNRVNHMTMGNGATGLGSFYESRKANIGTERTCGFSGVTSKHCSIRELSMSELRKMLIGKAQIEIRKKLQDWRSMAEAKVTNKDKGNERQKSTFNDKTTGPEKHGGSTINGNRHVDSDSIPVTSDDMVKDRSQSYVTINVPDSDFHNFDLDRAENSFEEDQVWAAYDDDDGMPRYYARIHKVISTKPFKIRISWLNSRSNSELGPIDWVGSGFYKTCGDFRTGGQKAPEELFASFLERGKSGRSIKNWSPDWNQNTPDEVIHKYDMVEVLEDFNEEEGVLVTPLVKVDGFKTVFHRDSRDQVRKIPKVEMFRFSHQVPNYLLTGQEAHNAPKGCRELDPAATPLDLQTTTEANEALDNVGKSKEDKLPISPEKRASGKAENAS